MAFAWRARTSSAISATVCSGRIDFLLLRLSSSRWLVIRFRADEFVGLLQGWVRFWVLDVQVMDDLGDQNLLTTGFQVPPAPAVPRLLRIAADVPIIR